MGAVGAGRRYYDDMLADADDALEALGMEEKSGTSVGSARSAGGGGGRGGGRGGGKGKSGVLKNTTTAARSRPTSAGRVRGGRSDAATRERLEAARSALDHLDEQADAAARKATASVTGW